MSKPNDGGPAFPEFRPIFDKEGRITGYREQKSMSLRDYFAAKAMVGFLTEAALAISDGEMVEMAYAIADAMLAERDKEAQDAK